MYHIYLRALSFSLPNFLVTFVDKSRANIHGCRPNTYVFTKAMGEMLVANMKDNVPLIIKRPTLIAGTHTEPFPGWIEDVRYLKSHLSMCRFPFAYIYIYIQKCYIV